MAPRVIGVCIVAAGLALAQLAPGTLIQARITTPADSAHSRTGDPVTATSTEAVKQGTLVLPKGTVFKGRVTGVVNATGMGGSLVVLFDQAVTPQGVTVPLLAGIASVTMPKPPRPGRSPFGGGPPQFPPASTGSSELRTPTIDFPADAATRGSVLFTPSGDVWLLPKTEIYLRVIAPAAK